MAQAAWADADRVIDGVPCAFVREPGRVRAGWWRRRPRALLRRVAAQNPDVVHFEGLAFPRELRALAAALPGIPILAQEHASKCPRGWRRPWYRWGFAPLAGVAFTSHAQARPFTAAGVLRRDLPVFEVIEVSSPFTPGDRGAARAETGLEGDPCLVWVGNLDANKDPLTVLDAASRAAARLPALRLHMCFRDAPLLDAVRARIAADPALAPRVRLVGPVPHSRIEPFLRAADFLVQASHAEGSGTALIEALACGTTPLVTDIPSFRRITDDGAVGALVRVGDSVALADALCDWSARDRPALRERARRHFERDLSFAAMGAQLRAAYQALWSMRHE
jgi:glycosyltransferase involved in cell wall biosynthesis